MKCEACAKREATVAYTHIVDDVKKTQFVCWCAPGRRRTMLPRARNPRPRMCPNW